jgi:hypothetical protein
MKTDHIGERNMPGSVYIPYTEPEDQMILAARTLVVEAGKGTALFGSVGVILMALYVFAGA